MPLVDQLPAVLGDLALREGATNRPAPPADAIGGLMDLSAVAALPEAVGTRQPRQAGPDDDDSRRRGRVGLRNPAAH
jgi:hypothetical protein